MLRQLLKSQICPYLNHTQNAEIKIGSNNTNLIARTDFQYNKITLS